MTSEPAYLFHEYLPWVVVAISLLVAAGALAFSAYRLRRRRGAARYGSDQER